MLQTGQHTFPNTTDVGNAFAAPFSKTSSREIYQYATAPLGAILAKFISPMEGSYGGPYGHDKC